MLKHMDEFVCHVCVTYGAVQSEQKAVLFISAEKPNFHMGETLNKDLTASKLVNKRVHKHK